MVDFKTQTIAYEFSKQKTDNDFKPKLLQHSSLHQTQSYSFNDIGRYGGTHFMKRRNSQLQPVRFVRFGLNLGPQRAVEPIGKYSLPMRIKLSLESQQQEQPQQQQFQSSQVQNKFVSKSQKNLGAFTEQQSLRTSQNVESVSLSMIQAFRVSTSLENLKSRKLIMGSVSSLTYNDEMINQQKNARTFKLGLDNTGISQIKLLKNSSKVIRDFTQQPLQQASSYYILPRKQAYFKINRKFQSPVVIESQTSSPFKLSNCAAQVDNMERKSQIPKKGYLNFWKNIRQ